MKLDSLIPDANVAIFGASGGIGRAFVGHLSQMPEIKSISAFARTAPESADPRVVTGFVDITDEASIADAVQIATGEGPLDLVLVTTGILHRGDELRPEKSMRELDAQKMMQVLQVNTIGPALIAKHCLPKMRRGHKNVFAALSARVGSIGDNRLGGWASYRMSKAALNMVVRTLSIEQARRCADSIVVSLHPGTVDTQLSAPFSSRVPESKLFTPQASANYLLDVIEQLSPADSGYAYAWDGTRIEF